MQVDQTAQPQRRSVRGRQSRIIYIRLMQMASGVECPGRSCVRGWTLSSTSTTCSLKELILIATRPMLSRFVCAFAKNRCRCKQTGCRRRPHCRLPVACFRPQIPRDERAGLSVRKAHGDALTACELHHACAVTAHPYFVAHLPGLCLSRGQLRMLRIFLRFAHLARARCDCGRSHAVVTRVAYSPISGSTS